MSYRVLLRGSPSPTIAAEYECSIHGRFEIDAERDENGDAPEWMRCPHELIEDYFPGDPPAQCNELAEWRISAPLARVRKFEVVKGKSEKPERPTWTDTRNLGEGQSLAEWREDRAKIWEERRKQEVMAFAREHHERVIGGD